MRRSPERTSSLPVKRRCSSLSTRTIDGISPAWASCLSAERAQSELAFFDPRLYLASQEGQLQKSIEMGDLGIPLLFADNVIFMQGTEPDMHMPSICRTYAQNIYSTKHGSVARLTGNVTCFSMFRDFSDDYVSLLRDVVKTLH